MITLLVCIGAILTIALPVGVYVFKFVDHYGDFTYHCRVEISSGKIISEFRTPGKPSDDPLLNRTWNIDMNFVEARASSKTQASFEALSMRRKHFGDKAIE